MGGDNKKVKKWKYIVNGDERWAVGKKHVHHIDRYTVNWDRNTSNGRECRAECRVLST